ncbi:MAG TPA: hypothetical protein DCM08_02020, partial [Microscillaceae bacterium]|nr:hypothetical protein [Microscillaceae bacterium]
MKTKIFTLALIPIIAFLSWYLFAAVKGPIENAEKIEKVENAIKNKLHLLRELQVAYQIQNKSYAKTWEELIDFAKNGKFLIVNVREQDLGNDKVKVFRDTLGTKPVLDSLISKYQLEKNMPIQRKELLTSLLKDIDNLPVVPDGSGRKFSLFVGKVTEKSGVSVEVIEVKDQFPINPERGGSLDPAQRKNVDVMLDSLESKKKTTERNIRFAQNQIETIFKNDNLVKEYLELSTIEKEKGNREKVAALKEKLKPQLEKSKPFQDKLETYKEQMA